MDQLRDGETISYREMNDRAVREGIKSATIRQIKTIVLVWTILGEYRRRFNPDEERVRLERAVDPAEHRRRLGVRSELATFIIWYLYDKSRQADPEGESGQVFFSVRELQQAFMRDAVLTDLQPSTAEIQTALLYLSKIQAISLDGGLL